MFAPIGILAFNRLTHLQKVIQALLNNPEASESDLIIVSDGYKRSKDQDTVLTIRQYLKTIKGFKSIKIFELDHNLGVTQATFYLIDHLMEIHDRFIYLCDDTIVASSFLWYINQALEFYEHDPKVSSVMGYCHQPVFDKLLKSYPYDVVFSYGFHDYGWGSWKSKWQKVEWNIPQAILKQRWKPLKKKGILKSWGHLLAMNKVLKRYPEIELWDILYVFHHLYTDTYAVWPRHSYVCNIGMDGSGIHGFNFSNVFEFNISPKQSIQFISYEQAKSIVNTRWFNIKCSFYLYRFWIQSFTVQFLIFMKQKFLLKKN